MGTRYFHANATIWSILNLAKSALMVERIMRTMMVFIRKYTGFRIFSRPGGAGPRGPPR